MAVATGFTQKPKIAGRTQCSFPIKRLNRSEQSPPISFLTGLCFLYNENERIGIMKDLLLSIVYGLVEDRDSVSVEVDEPNDDGIIVYHLHVASDDMGRVIGKQGRIAKAIRTVMRAGAGRVNQKIMVEID